MFSFLFFMDWIFIFISGPYGVCRVALKSPDFGIKRYKFKTCLFSILPMWPWKNTICLLWSYCLRLAHHDSFFFLIYILIVKYKSSWNIRAYLITSFKFLHLLSFVALGLHCCIEWGRSLLRHTGFSFQRLLLLRSLGSRHMGCSSTHGSVVAARRL